jgi:hypothetical protein
MLYPNLTVDELRNGRHLVDEYEAKVSQLQGLMYNLLILHRFHDKQKEVSVDKLRYDLYTDEWKPVRTQGCR